MVSLLELLLWTIVIHIVLAILVLYSLLITLIVVVVILHLSSLILMTVIWIKILPMSKIILLCGTIVPGLTSSGAIRVWRIHVGGILEIRLLHIIWVASDLLLLIILLLPIRVFVASMIEALLFSSPILVMLLSTWITISHELNY